jgi:hypothetical protein
MTTHPDLVALTEFARETGPPAADDDRAAHVASCPQCLTIVRRLRVVTAAARRDAETTPPPEVVQRALEIGRAVTEGPETTVFARLVLDTFALGAPAGIRTADQRRQGVYETGAWAIVVQLTRAGGEIQVTGQVAHRDEPARVVGPVPVLARSGGEVLARTATADSGEFTLMAPVRPDLHLQVLLAPGPVVMVPLQPLLG